MLEGKFQLHPTSSWFKLVYKGDFVDRGYYSLESLTLLMALKARFVLIDGDIRII